MNAPRYLTVFLLTVLLTTPLPSLAETKVPDGATYEIGFSPRGDSLEIILKSIEQAKTSIYVAAYSFTSKPISTALLEAHKRGVDVKLVADKQSNGTKYTATKFLANQGVPVRLNGHYAIFHHKFMIIDEETVETGSFNYSAAAVDKNAENVMILRHVKPIADTYKKEWQRLWDEATPLAGY